MLLIIIVVIIRA